MPSLASQFAKAIHDLTHSHAREAQRLAPVIKRRRKFDAGTLAATFAFGHLQHPKASAAQLSQTAGLFGVSVSPQACDQRCTTATAQFLRTLTSLALRQIVAAPQSLVPLLRRFADVRIVDSTVVSLPDSAAGEFPGCGGSPGTPSAAVKIQAQLSLSTGALSAVAFEAGRATDVASPIQLEPLPKNSLRIQDLGYFDTTVFEAIEAAGSSWLSPLATGLKVFEQGGDTPIDLLPWLASQGSTVDVRVRITGRKFPVRLVAWRLPAGVAERRRTRLRKTAKRKGQSVSAARLARCGWAVLATNAPVKRLAFDEVRVLYKARWQVELLFRRWKSQGLLDEMDGSNPTRCMVKFWSRLLAATVQQWLGSGVWGLEGVSLKKVWDTVRSMAGMIASVAVEGKGELEELWRHLLSVLIKTCRQNRRKKPSTFQLLHDPSKLDYVLS
jgi:hypothetical protein